MIRACLLGVLAACCCARTGAPPPAAAVAAIAQSAAPLAPAAPHGAEPPAQMLSQEQGRALLAIDPYVDPYRPRLPKPLNVAGASFWGLFKLCVSTTGAVTTIETVRSTGQVALDQTWMRTMWDWRFRPYLVAGLATPFCYPTRLQITAQL